MPSVIEETSPEQQSKEPAVLYIKLVYAGCGVLFNGFSDDVSWIDADILRLALNEYVDEAIRILQFIIRRKAGLTSPDDLFIYDMYRFIRLYCANTAASLASKGNNEMRKLASAYKAVFLDIERYMMQPSVAREILELHNDGAFVQLRINLKRQKGKTIPWFLSKRRLHNIVKGR